MGQNCAGGHDFIRAVYLKGRYNVWNRGDVVTVKLQFPRRFRQICYNKQNLAQRLRAERDVNTSRHKANTKAMPGLFKHPDERRIQCQIQQIHAPRCQSRRDGAYSNNRGKRRINLTKTFSCDNLAIIAEFTF